MTEEQMREAFRYHSPNPESVEKFETIREAGQAAQNLEA